MIRGICGSSNSNSNRPGNENGDRNDHGDDNMNELKHMQINSRISASLLFAP